MGSLTVILVLASSVVFGVLTMNIHRKLSYSTETTAQHYSDVRARDIANSTSGMLLSLISDSAAWRSPVLTTRTILGGTASYRVVDTTLSGESLVKVFVKADFMNRSKSVTTYAVAGGGKLPPQFLQYAALAGSDMILNGEDYDLRADIDPNLNANLHTNAKMTFNGEDLFVGGFVTYNTSITADWSETTIQPPYNPTGLPVHSKAAKVTIPAFNATTHRSKASPGRDYPGDLTLSGTIDYGSTPNPVIVYVGGKLSIKGTVTGNVIFLVKGDVEVKGSITLNPVSNETKVGIYTSGKYIMNTANSTVYAQVYADKELEINAEDCRVHGNLSTRSKLTINGEDFELRYRPANTLLSDPIWAGVTSNTGRMAIRFHYE